MPSKTDKEHRFEFGFTTILIGTMLFCLLLGFGFSGLPGQTKVQEAPEFSLKTLDGEDFVLSEKRGSVVLVNFWATWCPPCRIEIPHLKSVYEKYKGKGLEMIGISIDRKGEKVVQRFIEKNGIEYPVAMGSTEVLQKYGGIQSIPVTVIIDREGNIQHYWVGYRDENNFTSALEDLLDKKNTD